LSRVGFGSDLYDGGGIRRRHRRARAPPLPSWTPDRPVAAHRSHLGSAAEPPALPEAPHGVMRRPLRLAALAFLPHLLPAQGVTTAALQGTVVSENKTPVAGATVRVTNTLNGRRWEVLTRSTGGYLFEDVDVGGPYRVEVRALGFAPEARTGIELGLGQRLVTDFTLRPAAIELAPVA